MTPRAPSTNAVASDYSADFAAALRAPLAMERPGTASENPSLNVTLRAAPVGLYATYDRLPFTLKTA